MGNDPLVSIFETNETFFINESVISSGDKFEQVSHLSDLY